jgi:hypothetical protein
MGCLQHDSSCSHGTGATNHKKTRALEQVLEKKGSYGYSPMGTTIQLWCRKHDCSGRLAALPYAWQEEPHQGLPAAVKAAISCYDNVVLARFDRHPHSLWVSQRHSCQRAALRLKQEVWVLLERGLVCILAQLAVLGQLLLDMACALCAPVSKRSGPRKAAMQKDEVVPLLIQWYQTWLCRTASRMLNCRLQKGCLCLGTPHGKFGFSGV